MKPFVAACVVSLVLAVVVSRILENHQYTADEKYTSAASVSLGSYGKEKK